MTTPTPAEESSTFRFIAESPWINISAGFILMATSLLECLEPVFAYDTPIGAEHGMALLGFMQFVKFMPDMVKGIQFVQHGEKHTTAAPATPTTTASTATVPASSESPATAA